MTNIDSLNKNEIQDLLKELKLFSKLQKDLGKRGIKIFKKLKNNKKDFEVEYTSKIDLDFVKETSLEVYKNVFSQIPDLSEIKFTLKEDMVGGIRIYFEDNMVDISFQNILNKLK